MGPPSHRDEQWFTTNYTAHHAQIVKYGLRRLGDADAAVELAQEVFVIAWRRRADVPDHSLPWLYGVARRLLANEWRARRGVPRFVPMPQADDLRANTSHEADNSALELAALRAALAKLSEFDQEILRLVAWEDLPLTEAATVLGCTRATATVRLHRARRRLAAALATQSATGGAQPVTAKR